MRNTIIRLQCNISDKWYACKRVCTVLWEEIGLDIFKFFQAEWRFGYWLKPLCKFLFWAFVFFLTLMVLREKGK